MNLIFAGQTYENCCNAVMCVHLLDRSYAQVGQHLHLTMSIRSYLVPKKWDLPDLVKFVSLSTVSTHTRLSLAHD